MNNIFLVTEYEYDYDSHHHRNVKAFARYIDAETLRFSLQTLQERKNDLVEKAKMPFNEWLIENPAPGLPKVDVKYPQWNPKNGKKKTADPAIVAAFEAEEERVEQICRAASVKYHELYAVWYAAALAKTRAIYAELGLTEATIDTIATQMCRTHYDYEVEEVELA